MHLLQAYGQYLTASSGLSWHWHSLPVLLLKSCRPSQAIDMCAMFLDATTAVHIDSESSSAFFTHLLCT